MPGPVVETKRRLDPDGVAAVAALQAAAVAAGVDEPLGEQVWLDLARPGSGSVGVTARTDPGAPLLGYAHLLRHGGEWTVEALVGPAAGDEVRRVLLAAVIGEVGAQGGGRLHYWVHRTGEEADRLAAALGFEPERTLLQMRVPLPLPAPAPAPPTGVTLRPFRPGADDRAWLEVNNRAFAGHPEQGNWTVADLARRRSEPWFDPAGFLVAEDAAGRLLGSCWTKVHTDTDPPMGEIYVISVDPAAHGKGLGRLLTAAGLQRLADRQLTVGMLYVDAANTAAVGLYHALGFTTHHADRAYSLTVAGPPDGAAPGQAAG